MGTAVNNLPAVAAAADDDYVVVYDTSGAIVGKMLRSVLLGVGSTVQGYDAQLAAIAALARTDGNIIVGDGSTWVAESGATARTSLGLIIGTDVQAYNALLAAIAGLTPTDGNIIVGDGATFVAESGATARTSLGLGAGDTPTFAGMNDGPLAGLRNALMNGCFRVWQRGTSFTSATTPANNDDTHLADRWCLLSDGNDILDVSQETTTVPTGNYAAAKLDVETANKRAGLV